MSSDQGDDRWEGPAAPTADRHPDPLDLPAPPPAAFRPPPPLPARAAPLPPPPLPAQAGPLRYPPVPAPLPAQSWRTTPVGAVHPTAWAPAGTGGPMVLPKNPAVMVIASFLFSGLGSLLCGKKLGLLFMAIEIAAWVCLVIPVVGWILGLVFSPVFFGAWVIGMFHAHHSATAWNREFGIIS